MIGDRQQQGISKLPVCFYYKLWIFWLMIAGDLMLVALGLFVAFGETQPPIVVVMGAGLAAGCGGQAYFFFREIMAEGPAFVIGAEGVSSRRIGPEMIPWDAIENISLAKQGFSRTISFKLSDVNKYYRPPYWVVRLVRFFDLARMLGSISLYLDGMNGSNDDFRAAIKRFVPEGQDFKL